jgi:hypothetical protein
MPGVSQQVKAYAGLIRSGSIAAGAVLGHLGLVLLVCALVAVCRALWEGARPHVVTFGSAATATLFGWLRRKCRLPPEA